jgi:MFS superfamily sulfate permease-like transporter
MKTQMNIPADGLKGLKQNWTKDIVSGLIVSLLALPLSLGIAQASDFPPIMGVLTAIIGGTVVSLIAGSKLTIKGPAAGLIVIVAGAVSEFGGGTAGWSMALGAIVVAALLQIILGFLNFGKLVDYFPHTVVHGMLGAIGFIILSKQLHLLMGVNPVHTEGPLKGKPLVEPIELFSALPDTYQTLLENHEHQIIFLIGIICLLIVFGWTVISDKILKKIPAPLAVLALSIPLAGLLGFKQIQGGLLHVDNLFKAVDFNVNFSGITQHPGTFIKYVLMFALIGGTESLLTVKAIDIMDPFKRKANANRDLIAVGVGNAIAGTLGGLPMISEVARSSANVNSGARTRWANFFHGTFLIIFVVLLVPVIELIPKVALAAILIGVGYKLASIKEFIHIFKVGWWQLVVMVSTTIAILFTDLLVGVGIGLAIKFTIHYLGGLPIKNTFKAGIHIENNEGRYLVKISGGAVVTNLPGIMKKLNELPQGQKIYVDLSECILVDHTSMETFKEFKKEYTEDGGSFEFSGLERHKSISKHSDSTQFLPKEVRKDLKNRQTKAADNQRKDATDHEHRIN